MSCSHGFQPGTICYKYPTNPRFEMAATRHVRLPRTVCKCENSSAVNLRNVTMSRRIHPTFHHILPSHSLKFSLQKHPGTNKPTKLPNISTRFASCSTHAMPCHARPSRWSDWNHGASTCPPRTRQRSTVARPRRAAFLGAQWVIYTA